MKLETIIEAGAKAYGEGFWDGAVAALCDVLHYGHDEAEAIVNELAMNVPGWVLEHSDTDAAVEKRYGAAAPVA